MISSPLLTDQVVTLRRFRPDDAQALYEAVRESLPDLIPWLAWASPAYSLRDAQEYLHLADRKWGTELYVFAVTDARDHSLAGAVSLTLLRPNAYYSNLGYWIRSSRRGQGLAGRAARLAARFGLEHLGLQRIEIVVDVENYASQRAAEKSGARREGILRHRILYHNQPRDAWMFSFIRTDFGLSPL